MLIIKPLAKAAQALRIGRTRMTAAERKALLVAAALFLLGALVRFYRSRPALMPAHEATRILEPANNN